MDWLTIWIAYHSIERGRSTIYLNGHFACQKACQSTWQEFEHENLQIWHAKWLPEMEEKQPPDHLVGAKTPQKGAKTPQKGAKTVQKGAKTSQKGAKTVQKGAKTRQKGARAKRAPHFRMFWPHVLRHSLLLHW